MGSTPGRNDPAAAGGGHTRRQSRHGDDHTMEDQSNAARPACRDDIWSFKTCHTRHVEHSASTPIQRPLLSLLHQDQSRQPFGASSF
jgi:hypothetical protein